MSSAEATFFNDEWPEPDALRLALETWARTTAGSDPRIVKVGYVQLDETTENGFASHLDLILLMKDFDVPPAERGGIWDLATVPVPAQTLVYTVDEWTDFVADDDPLSRKLSEEVRWVFGA